MRGDVLERVYQWPLVVTRDPAVGAPALIPLRAPRALTHPSISRSDK
jgi:iron complex transport system ATP-binding protein